MTKKWKCKESAIVFEHPRLTLIEDQVILPNGKQTTYLRFKHINDCVLIIPERRDGKILMQKEYSYPHDKELLQFPGGFLKNGEKPKDGANRELSEESNIQAGKLTSLGYFYLDNRRSETKVFVYLGQDLAEPGISQDKDDEENITNLWYTKNEIDQMITSGKIVIFPVLSAWCIYKSKAR